jgi:hypothetical protein
VRGTTVRVTWQTTPRTHSPSAVSVGDTAALEVKAGSTAGEAATQHRQAAIPKFH